MSHAHGQPPGRESKEPAARAKAAPAPSDGRAAVVDVVVVEDEEGDLSAVDGGGSVTVGELVDGALDVASAVGTAARRLVDRGRYRKLRISRGGKPVAPDIPLAAVAALEAASLYGAGFARVLAVHVGARLLFDVEVVNDADRYFSVGQEALLEGNLDRAEQALLKAVRIDDTHAAAYLQLGVLYRLRQEPKKAIAVLDRARVLDDAGETGKKAEHILEAMLREAGEP